MNQWICFSCWVIFYFQPWDGKSLRSKPREEVFHSKMGKSVAMRNALVNKPGLPRRVWFVQEQNMEFAQMSKGKCFFKGPSVTPLLSCSVDALAEAGLELVTLGFRGAVYPAIKREFHPERKVFELDKNKQAVLDATGERVRLQNPRWRAILMQSTIDYL